MLGAPSAGAERLAQRLQAALKTQSQFEITTPAKPVAGLDLVLLMGLPAANASAPSRTAQTEADIGLRAQLQSLSVPFRVVYGEGQAQLSNALLALGLTPDEATRVQRTEAQFDLNRGRTPWSCEKCSDPDCEHRLFTGLLGR